MTKLTPKVLRLFGNPGVGTYFPPEGLWAFVERSGLLLEENRGTYACVNVLD